MNAHQLYKSIVNKVIEIQSISLPYLFQETDADINIVKEYDIFTDNELKILEFYNPCRDELIEDYLKHPKIKNIHITIPDNIKQALLFLKNEGYSPQGICYDIECENCFDYDADIEINKWINENNKQQEKTVKITKLYEYMINNPEFTE